MSHGWTKEAAEAYGRRIAAKANDEPDIDALQEEFDAMLAEIDAFWGPSGDAAIAAMNLASEYAQYTDELGNYLIEGVADFIRDDDEDYRYAYDMTHADSANDPGANDNEPAPYTGYGYYGEALN